MDGHGQDRRDVDPSIRRRGRVTGHEREQSRSGRESGGRHRADGGRTKADRRGGDIRDESGQEGRPLRRVAPLERTALGAAHGDRGGEAKSGLVRVIATPPHGSPSSATLVLAA